MSGHAPNRLDAALTRLEKTVKDAEHSMRHLRAAIEHQRKIGVFDEKRVLVEVEKILTRQELDAEDINNLADRLQKEAP
jgi:hypothetical protein